LADRKWKVVEPPLRNMAQLRQTAVSKGCTRSQTQPSPPPISENCFPEADESSVRRIDKENDNTEEEQGSVRRKRAWEADGVSGLGEAGDQDEKAKRRDDEMDSGKGPAKSKVKMGKGKQPAASSERNSAIEKIK